MSDFTELIQEFERVKKTLGPNVAGITTAEIAEEKQWGLSKTLRVVRTLIKAGVLQYVGKKKIVDIAGTIQSVPAYDFVKKGKKK